MNNIEPVDSVCIGCSDTDCSVRTAPYGRTEKATPERIGVQDIGGCLICGSVGCTECTFAETARRAGRSQDLISELRWHGPDAFDTFEHGCMAEFAHCFALMAQEMLVTLEDDHELVAALRHVRHARDAALRLYREQIREH